MKPKKIAIITAVAGQGHMSAALALDYWFTEWGYHSEVFNIAPSVTDDVHKLLMLYPKAYKSFFRISNNMRLSRVAIKSATNLIENKLIEILPKYPQYDCVISTYPMIHPQKVKKKVMMILDPVVHAAYLTQPLMDYYYLYWNESYKYFNKHRMGDLKKFNPGPLARASFYEKGLMLKSGLDRSHFKKLLGIPPEKKICLITAGGSWIYRSKKYVNLFHKYFDSKNIQFVFICGKQEEFCEEMHEKYPVSDLVKFLGWQDEASISTWMAAADYIIGFSVAQMLVEAGLLRVPFFLFEYTEGQEEGYLDVISKNKIGEYIEGNKKDKVLAFKKIIESSKMPYTESLVKWQNYLLNAPSETKKIFDEILK